MAIQNVAACLDAGQCLVLTKGVFQAFVAFGILAAIFLIILVLLSLFTPAIIFLKAKFGKAGLIYVVNRGQQGQFMIASSKHQGIADVKKVGPFIITENSHTVEQKSKLPFYFAFGEFAATLPLQFANVVQYLRDTGTKVTNIDDLAEVVGMKFNDITKSWDKIPEHKITDERLQRIREIDVMIKPYKTIRIHDLAYMFPFNITPALIESKTQHMIGLKMSMFNKLTIQYVIMFIMVLMGATLAAVIAFKFLKTGDTTGVVETRTIIERIVTTSGVGNLTG